MGEVAWTAFTSIASSGGANPTAVITKASHGLTTGDRVAVKDTGSQDGHWYIEVVNVNSFKLLESEWRGDETVGSYHLAPAHTWNYRIAIPATCIGLRTVNGYEANKPNTFFTIEAGSIFTNEEEVALVYSKKQVGGTDEASFDPNFVEAFACLLAAHLAMAIVGAMSRRNDMMVLYEEEIQGALISNIIERRDPTIERREAGTSYYERMGASEFN